MTLTSVAQDCDGLVLYATATGCGWTRRPSLALVNAMAQFTANRSAAEWLRRSPAPVAPVPSGSGRWDNLTDAQLGEMPARALEARMALLAVIAADRRTRPDAADVAQARDRAMTVWTARTA